MHLGLRTKQKQNQELNFRSVIWYIKYSLCPETGGLNQLPNTGILRHWRCPGVSHLVPSCCSRRAQVSCRSCVISASLGWMSWAPWGVPDGTRCLYLSDWLKPRLSFLYRLSSYTLLQTEEIQFRNHWNLLEDKREKGYISSETESVWDGATAAVWHKKPGLVHVLWGEKKKRERKPEKRIQRKRIYTAVFWDVGSTVNPWFLWFFTFCNWLYPGLTKEASSSTTVPRFYFASHVKHDTPVTYIGKQHTFSTPKSFYITSMVLKEHILNPPPLLRE